MYAAYPTISLTQLHTITYCIDHIKYDVQDIQGTIQTQDPISCVFFPAIFAAGLKRLSNLYIQISKSLPLHSAREMLK